MRRLVLAIVVAMLVVTAGCIGADLGGDPNATEDQSATDGLADNGADADGLAEGDGDADRGTENERAPDGDLEIHHLDVGQADSTLLITPADETILVDTGDWRDDGSTVVSALAERGIDRIDHLVTTHGHADHIGGHAAVIEHVEERGDGIGAVYDPGVAHTSRTYENYLDAIEEYDVTLFEVQAGDELPIEAVSATVLNPPAEPFGDDVDANSVALSIEFGAVTYVTTGDAEESAERRMVEEYADRLDADVYQAGHHGSSTSSTPPFLDAVDPEIAVISSPRDSQYGHPHDEVLAALAERDVETYWTGVHGDVVIRTDGEDVAVDVETEFPTDPDELLAEKPRGESIGAPAFDGDRPPTGT